MSAAQYNLDQLIIVLNESIQLESEIERASTSSKTYHGQLTTYPKDVHKYDSSHRSDSKDHRNNRSQRYNDPYRYNQGYQRDRSRSASRFQRYESRSLNRFRNNSRTRFDRSRSSSRFRFGDRRSGWNKEYPRTNPSLCNMSCIGRGSSQHLLADRNCTPSLEQIKTNLMSRNFPAHQAEAIAQLHRSRIVSNIRYSQASNSSSDTPSQSTEDNQVSILKDTNNKSEAPSYIRHINIPNELLDLMEEQKLENYLSMPEYDLKMYEDETTITYLSFPIYQVHAVDLVLFFVNTGAPHSCIGDKALERIFSHSGR